MINEIVQLARLALTGKQADVEMYVKRLAKRLSEDYPEAAKELRQAAGSAQRSSLKREVAAVPVDSDSRLDLVRSESPVGVPRPVWADDLRELMEQVVEERQHWTELSDADLEPTRSMLFTGPPGVGKTLSARWIASELSLPLLVLDLSAVMSSFLGRTGNNLRNVLDYARGMECVLLLDEFDAVAKRRDDAIEVGELKRLVTVLLQEIETWPSSGVLIAATNHPELLDPAVWRRFDTVVEFALPDGRAIRAELEALLRPDEILDPVREALILAFAGRSFSDIERDVRRAKREAIVKGETLESRLFAWIQANCDPADRTDRVRMTENLIRSGATERAIQAATGLSRDTIRKMKRNLSA